jgi:hypothetical protein
MSTYSKAIAAFLTSAIGLVVSFGYLDEAQAQQIGVVATGLVNLLMVYLIPNKE